jgi:hypothetical protein
MLVRRERTAAAGPRPPAPPPPPPCDSVHGAQAAQAVGGGGGGGGGGGESAPHVTRSVTRRSHRCPHTCLGFVSGGGRAWPSRARATLSAGSGAGGGGGGGLGPRSHHGRGAVQCARGGACRSAVERRHRGRQVFTRVDGAAPGARGRRPARPHHPPAAGHALPRGGVDFQWGSNRVSTGFQGF